VIGTEGPEIELGRAGTTGEKAPCFVATPTRLLLPAFAPRSPGQDVRTGKLATQLATEADHTKVLAIVGQRLLPVALRPSTA
jgi:metallophosphoesterase superfamily enzyme